MNNTGLKGTKYTVQAAGLVLAGILALACKDPLINRDNIFTITFNANGGDIAGAAAVTMQTDDRGRLTSSLPKPARADHSFAGWFTGGGTPVARGQTVFDAHTTVMAHWISSIAPPEEERIFAAFLEGLEGRIRNGEKNFTFSVLRDETIPPHAFRYDTADKINVTLTGDPNAIATVRLINMGGGSLFTVDRNVTLTLRNISLVGIETNTAPLITVQNEGKLIMEDGSAVSGNTNGYFGNREGGGVLVRSGASFTMNGGAIFENDTWPSGGGVKLNAGASFVMNGGKIHNNTAPIAGGVEVNATATFTMNDGEIHDNQSIVTGGGVNIDGMRMRPGTFTMYGGKIYQNMAGEGAGVRAMEFGEFYMYGGEIFENDASAGGGVSNSGLFVMYDGDIYENGAIHYGGGVWSSEYGDFHMIYGRIYENHVMGDPIDGGGSGGGVAVMWGGRFRMDGGAIYRNESANSGGGVANDQDGYFIMNGGTISENIARTTGGGVLTMNSNFMKAGGVIHGTNAVGLANTAMQGGAALFVGRGFVTGDPTFALYGLKQKEYDEDGNIVSEGTWIIDTAILDPDIPYDPDDWDSQPVYIEVGGDLATSNNTVEVRMEGGKLVWQTP